MAAFHCRGFPANGRFRSWPPSAEGTEHSLTTGRFQEAKFHWPLSGNESWKTTVASVSFADTDLASRRKRSEVPTSRHRLGLRHIGWAVGRYQPNAPREFRRERERYRLWPYDLASPLLGIADRPILSLDAFDASKDYDVVAQRSDHGFVERSQVPGGGWVGGLKELKDHYSAVGAMIDGEHSQGAR